MEAANDLEVRLRKADEEAKALKEEHRQVEEEKASLAAAAAKQKKQTQEEVRSMNCRATVCSVVNAQFVVSVSI